MKLYQIKSTGRFYNKLSVARGALANSDWYRKHHVIPAKNIWERDQHVTLAGRDDSIIEYDLVEVGVIDNIVSGEIYPWHNKSEMQLVDEQIARLIAKRDKLLGDKPRQMASGSVDQAG